MAMPSDAIKKPKALQHQRGLGRQHTRHRSWNGRLAHVYGVRVADQWCKIKGQIQPFDGAAYP